MASTFWLRNRLCRGPVRAFSVESSHKSAPDTPAGTASTCNHTDPAWTSRFGMNISDPTDPTANSSSMQPDLERVFCRFFRRAIQQRHNRVVSWAQHQNDLSPKHHTTKTKPNNATLTFLLGELQRGALVDGAH
eukprot:609797-Rhodomonas_salina.3